MKKKGEAYWDFERCYVSTKHLPDLVKGALIVTDTPYDFCTPAEKGDDYCQ